MSAFNISGEISDAATEAAKHDSSCPAHPENHVMDYCSCGAQESHEDAVRRFIAAMGEAGFAFAIIAREDRVSAALDRVAADVRENGPSDGRFRP